MFETPEPVTLKEDVVKELKEAVTADNRLEKYPYTDETFVTEVMLKFFKSRLDSASMSAAE